MSLFYTKSKTVTLANDLLKIGSTIMAYWSGNGNCLTNIDYSVCHVGVILSFLKHTITIVGESAPRSFALCYVKWKQQHPHFDFFGKSATVSSTLDEVESVCSYMPVQQVAYRCAYGEMSVDFGPIRELVFVTSPIALKFCL